MLEDSDNAVRYRATMGILMRGRDAAAAATDDLKKALKDDSPYVRIAAAEALGGSAARSDLSAALPVLVDSLTCTSTASTSRSSRSTQSMPWPPGGRSTTGHRFAAEIRSSVNRKMQEYVPRLLEVIAADSRDQAP
jgi:hypothetical protein